MPLDPPPTEPRPDGAAIRAARRARVHRIRRRVATGAVVSFLAAWGVVYTQMRAGDDPALGATTKVAQVDAATTTTTTSTDDTTATPTDDTTATQAADSSTLTTAQS